MDQFSRRSFVAKSIFGMAAIAGSSLPAQEKPKIQGFDQTQTDIDATQKWTPYSDRKIKVGIVGYGVCQFGAQFGFQNHPNVEVVAVSDLFPDRCDGLAKACRCTRKYTSLEEMLQKDKEIEAVFVATDAPSHADHCIKVLKAGKHVASAVPAIFGSLEMAEKLFETVKKTGLIYAMFETSAFHDDVYASRKIYQAGGFGDLVYTEGEYFHYGLHSADSYKDWRTGMPVQWYPTHATAYYTCVTGKSFTRVSCLGKKSIQDYRYSPSGKYKNLFGTETALYQTAENGMARMIVSFDTPGPYGEVGRSRGQKGAYYDHYIGADDAMNALVAKLNLKKPALPPTMDAGSHGGSHGYLSNDFIDAILRGRLPLVNIAVALNTTVCGVVAHQSALKDGESMIIPQYTLD